MVDKVRAIELRNSGLTYNKIAEELKCSVDWCKRNLQGVSKYPERATKFDSNKSLEDRIADLENCVSLLLSKE